MANQTSTTDLHERLFEFVKMTSSELALDYGSRKDVELLRFVKDRSDMTSTSRDSKRFLEKGHSIRTLRILSCNMEGTRLLHLSAELRNAIQHDLLVIKAKPVTDRTASYSWSLRTCKQIHNEVTALLYIKRTLDIKCLTAHTGG